MSPTPFPLYWPDTVPPTDFPSKKTKGVTLKRAATAITKVLTAPHGPLRSVTLDFVISTNVPIVGSRGGPAKDWRKQMKGKSPGAAVYFNDPRSKTRYVVACDTYVKVEDNLLACAKQLHGLCLILKNCCFKVWHKILEPFLWAPEREEERKAKAEQEESRRRAKEKNDLWREQMGREQRQADEAARRRKAEQERQDEARRGREHAGGRTSSGRAEPDWHDLWSKMFTGGSMPQPDSRFFFDPENMPGGSKTAPPPKPPPPPWTPPQPTKNTYKHWSEILSVSRNCSALDAEKAYKKQINLAHPDKGGTTEQAQEVNNAYDQFKRERGIK